MVVLEAWEVVVLDSAVLGVLDWVLLGDCVSLDWVQVVV